MHMENVITRVSVVEDTDAIRENIVAYINAAEDMECISNYSSAETALKGLIKDNPDVVIMDIGLPAMSGTECMLRVKLKCPDISFLMYTVFQEDDKIFDALKSGASGYILKEDRASIAINAVRDFVKGGGPMSPTIAKKVIDSFHKYQQQNEIIEKLSDTEYKIIQKIAEGKLNKEIAYEIDTSEDYVKVCVHRIYKKLHVNNRVEALRKYLDIDN